MSPKVTLTDGSPVPEDGSHREDRGDGQQRGYVVLSEEERRKGFIKPLRRSYVHSSCGTSTTMGRSLAETYARDPYFYSGTYCCHCHTHFPLAEFTWDDGEPMDPLRQGDWQDRQKELRELRRKRRIAELKRELEELEREGQE